MITDPIGYWLPALGDSKKTALRMRPLLIGTRGSPLALWQANHVRDLLIANGLPPGDVDFAVIKTLGDTIQDVALREFGGKGLFTKEIDEALLAARIDLAVHSMKDLPTVLPGGIVIGAILRRGDVRDALIARDGQALKRLPPGAVLGTSSLRRQAQIRRLRPDLQIIDFRGNVETRIRKLDEGKAEATVLALAGLERLGLTNHVTEILPTDLMLPAVAQGAIGVAMREKDERVAALLPPLNDAATATAVDCERSFLKELDGSCRTPIAGLAEIENDLLRFRGLILTPDGKSWHEVEMTGPAADAARIGADAGKDLLTGAGPDFLTDFRAG
jgi:hydroxymethylbilane synthase